jgi:hypothetical protein
MKAKTFAFCFASMALFLCLEAAEGPGGKVALVRDSELWLAAIDGSGLVQLTNDGERKATPAWSQDGAKLAYLPEVDRQKALSRIAVMTLETKEVRQFVFRPTSANIAGMRFVEQLRMLADNRIALIGSVNPVNCEYVVVDINSGKELSWSLGLCGSFVTSPDGKHVAYPGAPGMFTPEEDWRQRIEFDNDRRAYTPAGPSGRLLTDPVWSADSTQIAVLEHDLQTKAKGVVIVSLKGEVTRIPLPLSFEMPMELEWAGNTLALHAGGERYTIDPTAKAMHTPYVDVDERLAVQAAKKGAVDETRKRGIEVAKGLGAKEYNVDVFVPGPAPQP